MRRQFQHGWDRVLFRPDMNRSKARLVAVRSPSEAFVPERNSFGMQEAIRISVGVLLCVGLGLGLLSVREQRVTLLVDTHAAPA